MKFLSNIPAPLKWLLGLAVLAAVLAFGAMYGFVILMVLLLMGVAVGAYWPAMLLYIAGCGALGALITRARDNKNPAGPGVWKGVSFALISLVVGMVLLALNAIATGFH